MTLIAPLPLENRFVAFGVGWSSYRQIRDAFEERPIRVTYDRGAMEIMTLSREHEQLKSLLGRLIECVMLERGLDFENGGSMTFQREDLERGLEPDECYWIANFPKVAGRSDYDCRMDPPPDLVIEVDVSHSSVNRMGIYAALKVPEVWRHTSKDGIQIHLLGADGVYQVAPESPTFAGLAISHLESSLQVGIAQGVSRGVRDLREWLQSST